MIVFHVLRFVAIAHATSVRGSIKQRGVVTVRSGTRDRALEIGLPIFATGVESFGANDSATLGTVLEEDPTSSSRSTSVDSNYGLSRLTLPRLEWVGDEGKPRDAFPLGECQGECGSDEMTAR